MIYFSIQEVAYSLERELRFLSFIEINGLVWQSQAARILRGDYKRSSMTSLTLGGV